ncbi:hypothetical protein [Actinoplanes sp. OR16]|uniref:hypothetical protein n=1 Tax=Actinoplanes sp. OR16 TaxID=946334 RepID=UPI000FDA8BC7|nr:hypothetical protein [Actinoplanes sp. OR16]
METLDGYRPAATALFGIRRPLFPFPLLALRVIAGRTCAVLIVIGGTARVARLSEEATSSKQ